ncbi:MAG: hypothetical protein QXL33_07800 [Sulfolobaceae archaeon]
MNARELIKEIRDEVKDLNEKILNHKFVKDIMKGNINLNKIKYFLVQQYYIARNDARALAIMYSRADYPDNEFFFKLLLGHQNALKALNDDLKSFNINFDNVVYSLNYRAISYTHFLQNLAYYGSLEEQIVAILINFPIFVININNIGNVLKERGIEVKFFLGAKWEEDLEDLGLKILDKNLDIDKEKLKRLKNVARLIQEYELEYWNSVYDIQ